MCSTKLKIFTICPCGGKICLCLTYTMKVNIYQFYSRQLALEKQWVCAQILFTACVNMGRIHNVLEACLPILEIGIMLSVT